MENTNFEIDKSANRVFIDKLDFDRTRRIYFALEKLSETAVVHLKAGQLKEFSFAADKMRPLLCYIADNNVKLSQHIGENIDAKDISIKDVAKKLNENLKVIRTALHTMGQVPFNPIFFTSEQLTHAFLDYQIPLAWEFEYDLIITLNLENRKLLDCLTERGQKRIFLIGGPLNSDVLKDSFPSDVGIFKFDDYKKLSDMMAIYADRPIRRVVVIDAGSQKTEKEVFDEIKELAKQGRMNAWMKFNTINRGDATKMLDNLSNMVEKQPTSDLHNMFCGQSAIIVCPGPSLQKNISVLKKVKGRALIICVLHALKVLKENGITPDIVIHTDPQNLKVLKTGDEENDPTLWEKWVRDEYFEGVKYFVTSSACVPDMFTIPAENILWMSSGIAVGDAFPISVYDYGRVGGSVSHSAFDLAIEFGFTSIALVGQDLSLSDEGAVYSDGSELDKEADKNLILGETFLVEGLNGNKVTTNSTYEFFAKMYSLFARELEGSGVNLFNCTEGGRFVEGFDHITLDQFIEKNLHSKKPDEISCEINKIKRDDKKYYSDKKKMRQFISKNMILSKEVDKLIDTASQIAKKDFHTDDDLMRFDTVQNRAIKKMKKNYFYTLGLQRDMYILMSGLSADRSTEGQLAFHLDFLSAAKSFNKKFTRAFKQQFHLISRH